MTISFSEMLRATVRLTTRSTRCHGSWALATPAVRRGSPISSPGAPRIPRPAGAPW